MNLPDTITLYFREGTSDKVYQAEIIKQGDGFVVNFAYGRRGAKMQTGTKTPKPVPRAKAEEIYAKLVTEKTDKGYATDEPDAAPEAPPRGAKGPAKSSGAVELDPKSLKWDGSEWNKTVDVPAFKAFKFEGSTSKAELRFYADDKDDAPSPGAIAVAAKVLENQDKLVTKAIDALWADIQGKGPDSGMWWRGDPDQMVDMIADDEISPPKQAKDLYKLMTAPNICVHKDRDDYDKPIVELSFGAAFEEEHGVGILTDGEKILGIGYSYDVQVFGSDEDGEDDDD